MIISSRNRFNNSLFLVCPMDRIELLIRKKFKGEKFFYSALGVYFEFDKQTQNNLWDLICRHGIDQVVFISAIDNAFYRQAFKKNRKQVYPADEALARTKEKIYEHLISSEIFVPNLHLLAARHMANQKMRLLSTKYLGDHIIKENIAVKAYLYHPQEENFCSLGEIEERGYLLSRTSNN